MNLYNKAYTSMKAVVPHFKNPEEALSCYLEGAAKYLTKAAKAARENRIEDRSNLSDKALLIFAGILSHFDQSSEEEKQELKSLMDYCSIMNDLILRMNMKNDAEMAASLATEIQRMAVHWKEKSEENFSKEQENAPPDSLDVDPIKSSDGKVVAPSYSLTGDLSTADFSA